MKRLFLGLLTAALVAFGAASHPASASTINVDPSPNDHFDVGGFFAAGGAFDKPYVFTLTQSATLSDNIFTENLSGFTLTLLDASNVAVSLASALQASVLYTLHISGTALANGVFAGEIDFAAAPVPPSLLLFATALVGLGAFGYRRRGATPAA